MENSITDQYAIMERWREERTPSGCWSRVRHDYEARIISREIYRNLISPWPGDRVQRTYTRDGYLPYRIANAGPDGAERCVWELTFLHEEYEIDRARAQFPQLFELNRDEAIAALESGRSCEFRQWVNLGVWDVLPTTDQLDQVEAAWEETEDPDFLSLRVQEIMGEITLQEVLQGKAFKVDGVDDFHLIESGEDYKMLIAAARQYGDFVAGFLRVYDPVGEDYRAEYITADFGGVICDHVIVPDAVDLCDFDPDHAGVDFPA